MGAHATLRRIAKGRTASASLYDAVEKEYQSKG
jgi:hypothetical protein